MSFQYSAKCTVTTAFFYDGSFKDSLLNLTLNLPPNAILFFLHSVFFLISSCLVEFLLCLQDLTVFEEDTAGTTSCITFFPHIVVMWLFSPSPSSSFPGHVSLKYSPFFPFLIFSPSINLPISSLSFCASVPSVLHLLLSLPSAPTSSGHHLLLSFFSCQAVSLFSVFLTFLSCPIIWGHAILDQSGSLIFQYPGRLASSKSDH